MCGTDCGCSCGHGHQRRFQTKTEQTEQLQKYATQLEKELQAVKDRIEEIK